MPKKNLLILKRQITRTIHYVNIFKFGILEVIGKGTKRDFKGTKRDFNLFLR